MKPRPEAFGGFSAPPRPSTWLQSGWFWKIAEVNPVVLVLAILVFAFHSALPTRQSEFRRSRFHALQSAFHFFNHSVPALAATWEPPWPFRLAIAYLQCGFPPFAKPASPDT